jgi:hypothetical protein
MVRTEPGLSVSSLEMRRAINSSSSLHSAKLLDERSAGSTFTGTPGRASIQFLGILADGEDVPSANAVSLGEDSDEKVDSNVGKEVLDPDGDGLGVLVSAGVKGDGGTGNETDDDSEAASDLEDGVSCRVGLRGAEPDGVALPLEEGLSEAVRLSLKEGEPDALSLIKGVSETDRLSLREG